MQFQFLSNVGKIAWSKLPSKTSLWAHPYQRIIIALGAVSSGPEDKQVGEGQKNTIFDRKVIKPAQTNCVPPVSFAQYRDEKYGFVLTIKIQRQQKRDAYHISRMDHCINSPGEATVFITLYAETDYRQVNIHGNECDKTYFASKYGNWWLFSHEIWFAKHNWNISKNDDCYADFNRAAVCPCNPGLSLYDIVFFSSFREQHIDHICNVLFLLKN